MRSHLCVGWLPQLSGAVSCCSWDDDGDSATSLLQAALVTPMPGKWALSASLPWEPAARGDFTAMLLQSTRGLNTPGSHICLAKEAEEVPGKGNASVAPPPPMPLKEASDGTAKKTGLQSAFIQPQFCSFPYPASPVKL